MQTQVSFRYRFDKVYKIVVFIINILLNWHVNEDMKVISDILISEITYVECIKKRIYYLV